VRQTRVTFVKLGSVTAVATGSGHILLSICVKYGTGNPQHFMELQVHYRVRKIPPLDPILVQAHLSFFFKIRLNIHNLHLGLYSGFFPPRFRTETLCFNFFFSPIRATCPAHPSDHPNSIPCAEPIMKIRCVSCETETKLQRFILVYFELQRDSVLDSSTLPHCWCRDGTTCAVSGLNIAAGAWK